MYPCSRQRAQRHQSGVVANNGSKSETYLEVGHVGLLVEGGRGQSESVDNVVDLRLSLGELLRSLLSRAGNEDETEEPKSVPKKKKIRDKGKDRTYALAPVLTSPSRMVTMEQSAS